MATLANDDLFNFVASLTRAQAEIAREAKRQVNQPMTCLICFELVPQGCCTCGEKRVLASNQVAGMYSDLLRLTDTLYEACGAFEAHYDAQLPYGHRSPLLVQARRAMEKCRELREESK